MPDLLVITVPISAHELAALLSIDVSVALLPLTRHGVDAGPDQLLGALAVGALVEELGLQDRVTVKCAEQFFGSPRADIWSALNDHVGHLSQDSAFSHGARRRALDKIVELMERSAADPGRRDLGQRISAIEAERGASPAGILAAWHSLVGDALGPEMRDEFLSENGWTIIEVSGTQVVLLADWDAGDGGPPSS